jgi:hypothetical protein
VPSAAASAAKHQLQLTAAANKSIVPSTELINIESYYLSTLIVCYQKDSATNQQLQQQDSSH